jgi:hypothetical protein
VPVPVPAPWILLASMTLETVVAKCHLVTG